MGDFKRSWDLYQEAGIRVFGLAVDSLEETQRMVRELALEFPVLSGLDASGIAEKTGIYLSPQDDSPRGPSGFAMGRGQRAGTGSGPGLAVRGKTHR